MGIRNSGFTHEIGRIHCFYSIDSKNIQTEFFESLISEISLDFSFDSIWAANFTSEIGKIDFISKTEYGTRIMIRILYSIY